MGKIDVKSFFVRALSGLVLCFVVFFSLLSIYGFVALMLVIAVGSLSEFYGMLKIAGYKPMAKYGLATTAIIVLLNALVATELIQVELLSVILLILVIPFAIQLYNKSGNPFVDISISLMGIIYIALPISLMVWIAIGNYFGGDEIGKLYNIFDGYMLAECELFRPDVILVCILMVWINDVGAYLVGVSMGRRKLFVRISPKKSWEGFFGGVVVSILFGAMIGLVSDQSLVKWGLLGVIVSVSGVYGDLVESMFKRFVGVKDSGNIMPGHGGFLDRFDALLFAVPFIFVYFSLFVFWN